MSTRTIVSFLIALVLFLLALNLLACGEQSEDPQGAAASVVLPGS